jgi:hypothetical protein
MMNMVVPSMISHWSAGDVGKINKAKWEGKKIMAKLRKQIGFQSFFSAMKRFHLLWEENQRKCRIMNGRKFLFSLQG